MFPVREPFQVKVIKTEQKLAEGIGQLRSSLIPTTDELLTILDSETSPRVERRVRDFMADWEKAIVSGMSLPDTNTPTTTKQESVSVDEIMQTMKDLQVEMRLGPRPDMQVGDRFWMDGKEYVCLGWTLMGLHYTPFTQPFEVTFSYDDDAAQIPHFEEYDIDEETDAKRN
jgi:hypothetical protein